MPWPVSPQKCAILARLCLEGQGWAEARTKELGFSLKDLMGGGSVKSPSQPKFQDPDNPDQDWARAKARLVCASAGSGQND